MDFFPYLLFPVSFCFVVVVVAVLYDQYLLLVYCDRESFIY